ncbi:MAG TPA: hypothetical protein VLT57_06625, partial [Bryobacteraceae bacterium]|nr:hypothetical protein [Bryobacteraceae bacterium]
MRLLWISNSDSPAFHLDGSFVAVRATPDEAIEHLRVSGFDVVLLALPQADWSGQDLVETLRRTEPGTPLIVQIPAAAAPEADELRQAGAFQVVCGDTISPDLLRKAAESRAAGDAHADASWRKLIAGESRAIRRVTEIIR